MEKWRRGGTVLKELRSKRNGDVALGCHILCNFEAVFHLAIKNISFPDT